MQKFLIIYPFGKLPDLSCWQGIECDPTNDFEAYIFVRKPVPDFNEIWNILTHTRRSEVLLGCYSLLYFVFYKELKLKIIDILSSEYSLNENKKKLEVFIKNRLNKWLTFIKRSDDSLYPQNQYFREIADILKPVFSDSIDDK